MPIAEKTEHLDTGEKIVEIELERLISFTNHPFKVQADSQMIELQDSIKKYGILNPLIVRPRPEGVYAGSGIHWCSRLAELAVFVDGGWHDTGFFYSFCTTLWRKG